MTFHALHHHLNSNQLRINYIVSLSLFSALYMGIKLFIIDYVYNRFPRVRAKHDTTYQVWKQLPTEAELERRNTRAEIDRVSTVFRYTVILSCFSPVVLLSNLVSCLLIVENTCRAIILCENFNFAFILENPETPYFKPKYFSIEIGRATQYSMPVAVMNQLHAFGLC
jgi:hypothetical protein